MSVTVEVRFNHFPGMPARLNGADRDIRMKWAQDVRAASIPYTPVDTGALVNNVTVEPGSVHWHQEYAAYQNMGTVFIAPKLFANHGADVATPGAIAAYRQIEGQLV
jgi:hypothetical protein